MAMVRRPMVHWRIVLRLLILCLLVLGSLVIDLVWFPPARPLPIASTKLSTPNDDTVPRLDHSFDAALDTETTASLSVTARVAVVPSTLHRWYEPLSTWEQVSIHNRTCQPPRDTVTTDAATSTATTNAIPDYCCMGASSGQGRVRYDLKGCNCGRDVYDRTEALALASVPPTLENESDMPCDWCRILDVLLTHNWTMGWVGDSVTGQSFFAAECEVRRRGLYLVQPSPVQWHQVNASHWKFNPYGLDAVYELRIAKRDDPTRSTTIRFYAMYRPHMDHMVSHVHAARHDVLMFDHGLHYMLRDMGAFERDMTAMLRTYLIDTNPHSYQLVAWRESSAQHFDTSDGEFSSRKRTCVALNASVPRPRRVVMERVIQSLNLTPVVAILDFWNYTRQFHELHPPGDCTHYCSTPSFWLYLWRQLRLALDGVVPLE